MSSEQADARAWYLHIWEFCLRLMPENVVHTHLLGHMTLIMVKCLFLYLVYKPHSWCQKNKFFCVECVCSKSRKRAPPSHSSPPEQIHLTFPLWHSLSIISQCNTCTTQPSFYSHLSHINRLPGRARAILVSSLSHSLSGNDSYLWVHAYLRDVFLLALSITLLTLMHHESIHLFGRGSSDPLGYLHLLFSASMQDSWGRRFFLGIRNVFFTSLLPCIENDLSLQVMLWRVC